MFAEAFYSTIKGIHLALEVKTSFGNSTLERIERAHKKLLIVVIGIARKNRTCTQKVTKKSFNDYTQQD
jgi:hypothetical protein